MLIGVRRPQVLRTYKAIIPSPLCSLLRVRRYIHIPPSWPFHSLRSAAPSSLSFQHFKVYSSTTSESLSSELDEREYHALSNEALEYLVDRFEEFGEELDLDGFDVEYSNGVLTLRLGPHGTYVINKQPPNRQIWLSSPFSGPKRYDFSKSSNKWIYRRDQSSIDDLLRQELSKILSADFDFNIPNDVS